MRLCRQGAEESCVTQWCHRSEWQKLALLGIAMAWCVHEVHTQARGPRTLAIGSMKSLPNAF